LAAELEESRACQLGRSGNMNTECIERRAREDPTEWADPAAVTEVFIIFASEESKNINGQRFEAQEENWGPEKQKPHTVSKAIIHVSSVLFHLTPELAADEPPSDAA